VLIARLSCYRGEDEASSRPYNEITFWEEVQGALDGKVQPGT
jgi:hypothetical protein